MNSQPKIVVTSTDIALGNARQGGRGIGLPPRPAGRWTRIGATALGLALLAACGQKGGLYLPEHAPASHRHGAAAKSAQPATPPSAPASTPANSTTQP